MKREKKIVRYPHAQELARQYNEGQKRTSRRIDEELPRGYFRLKFMDREQRKIFVKEEEKEKVTTRPNIFIMKH